MYIEEQCDVPDNRFQLYYERGWNVSIVLGKTVNGTAVYPQLGKLLLILLSGYSKEQYPYASYRAHVYLFCSRFTIWHSICT